MNLEYKEKDSIISEGDIVGLYWKDTYLNVILSRDIQELFLYEALTDEKISTIKVAQRHYKINIVNAENKDRVLFGSYTFFYNSKNLKLSEDLYPKLVGCDRSFRYGKGMLYLASFDLEEDELRVNFNFYKKSKKPPTNRLVSSKGNIFKKILGLMFKLSTLFLYKLLGLFRSSSKKRVLFLTMNSDEIKDNLKALYEYMEENTDLTLLKSSTNIFRKKDILKILQMIKNIAISNYIFIDNYSPLFNFLDLDKGVELVQLWHAGVGFKSVGYARFGKPSGPDIFISSHRKYTKAIAPTKKLVETYQDVFGISKDKFIVAGLPRLDGFLDKRDDFRETFYQKHSSLKGKKILLFAPTYRGTGQKSAYYNFEWLDFDAIEEFCKKTNSVFLIKMHPFIQDIEIDFESYDNILNFSEYEGFNDLLFVTDCLITDFSSNIYEAALCDVPIKFFAPDKNIYQYIRSTHRNLEEFEGSDISSNTNELIESLQSLEIQNWQRKFKELEVEDPNDASCRKIVEEVIFNA